MKPENQRKSQNDALGRLTAVWEAPNNTGYNYKTDYQCDALKQFDQRHSKRQ